MFKSLIFGLLMLLSANFVVAQTDSALADIDPSGQTIVYWHHWALHQQDAVESLVQQFNATNEWGITVEAINQGSTGTIADLVSAGIISGELPNLASSFQTAAQSFYLDGAVVALDDYMNDPVWGLGEERIAALLPERINDNRFPGEPFNDQLLLWPMGVSANVLNINMDMLAQVSYDRAPQTLEEMREVVCATSQIEGLRGFPIRTNASDLLSFVVSQGGHFFDEEADRYDFTNDAVITVLTWYQELINDGCAYIPESAFAGTNEMAFGLNPMGMGSTTGVPFINALIEDSESGVETWAMAEPPWSEGNRALQVFQTSLIMIPSTPEQQLATWLFIKFLDSAEGRSQWNQQVIYHPYAEGDDLLMSEEFLMEIPQWQQVMDIINNPDVRKFTAPRTLSYGQVAGLVADTVASVISGGADPLEAAEQLEADANAIHADVQGSLGR
ncbi:MAG: extracellular solute-binding protein [Chloroflexi bacterium]|nr:extracellular solute-binding protein [Chloroflexota bacterium]